MKKIVISILLIFILSLQIVCFGASKYFDVRYTKYENSVSYLSSMGIISGYPDGSFMPNNKVTRAQLSKMLVEGFVLKSHQELSGDKFLDVDKDEWYYDYVNTASEHGLVLGYSDKTFKPLQVVTYQEAITMLLRGMNEETNMKDRTWPTAYLKKAEELKLLENVSYDKPSDDALRGELSILLMNGFKIENAKRVKEAASKSGDSKVEPYTPAVPVNPVEPDYSDSSKSSDSSSTNPKDSDYSYGIEIVTSSIYKNNEYYISLDSSNILYDVKSINGNNNVDIALIEDVTDNIIYYRTDGINIHIISTYDIDTLSNASIITKINKNIVRFGDENFEWEVKKDDKGNPTKYPNHNIVLADVRTNSSDEVYYRDVKELGEGLNLDDLKVDDRVFVDDKNKILLIYRGLSKNAKIINDVVVEVDETTKHYGLVTYASSKKDGNGYIKVAGKTLNLTSSSTAFVQGGFAIYNVTDKDDVTLLAQFTPLDCDKNLQIVRKFNQDDEVEYKSGSVVNYTTRKNRDKYEDYLTIEIRATVEDEEVVFESYGTIPSISDYNFNEGDRVMIDDKQEAFVVIRGLKLDDNFKEGLLQNK